MERIPSKASEETSHFATPDNSPHALKLKDKLQTLHAEPSFLWRAATKLLPTAFLNLFRQRAPAPPSKEPLHCDVGLVKNNRKPAPKMFIWSNLGKLLFFILYIGANYPSWKHYCHNRRVHQANDDRWFAMNRMDEAHRELDEANKNYWNAPIMRQEESFLKAREAWRKYEEARDKLEETTAALKAQGIYREFLTVSAGEYKAWRARKHPGDIARGRALIEAHFQCTPSRNAELK